MTANLTRSPKSFVTGPVQTLWYVLCEEAYRVTIDFVELSWTSGVRLNVSFAGRDEGLGFSYLTVAQAISGRELKGVRSVYQSSVAPGANLTICVSFFFVLSLVSVPTRAPDRFAVGKAAANADAVSVRA